MKKALVTGATGFIGRNLVRLLVKNGIDVIAVGRKSANWSGLSCNIFSMYEFDLENLSHLPDLVPDRDIECVFHLAWQGVSDGDAKDYNVQLGNVNYTLDLVEAAHKMNIGKFLIAGSIHEYEVMVEMIGKERTSNLVNMYKTSKLASHWMGKALAGSYGIKFFCPLIINAYGEGECSFRLINSFIRKMMNGETMDLSDGTQLYDFVHVSDVAKALYLIAEKGVDGRDYIIGSGSSKPLREYLEEAYAIIKKSVVKNVGKPNYGALTSKAVFLPREAFDISKLRNDTGFAPEITFHEGISRIVNENLQKLHSAN